MAGGKGCWRFKDKRWQVGREAFLKIKDGRWEGMLALKCRREEVREEGFTRRLEAVRQPALSAVSALANSGL